MKKLFAAALAAASVVLVHSSTHALPRFALRGGDVNCRGCHVDPTGGRIRTEGGDNFASNRLAMWPTPDKFSANIGEGIRLGVDLRSQWLYFSDNVTGDLTIPRMLPDSSHILEHILRDTVVKANGGLEMALPIYLSAQLSKAVGAFVKFDALGNGGWEGYGIIHYVHSSGEFIESGSTVGDAYLKVGAFVPAFGIRFDDHTVYTRGGNTALSGFGAVGMFWQPSYRDEGFELGFELFDHAFITADILNGNERQPASVFKVDPTAPDAISVRAIVNSGPLMDGSLSAEIGGSMYIHTIQHLMNAAQHFDSTAQTRLVGIHGGIHVGPVSILAESDVGRFIFHNVTSQYSDTVTALAIEAAVEITKGLTGIVRFDDYHSGSAGTNPIDIKTRFMAGFQWFPVRFLEFRPEVRIARGTSPATNDPSQWVSRLPADTRNQLEDNTETTILLQTHIFF